MTKEQVLEVFRRCGALLQGHFVLRSGKHSRTFFQCALVLQDPVATAELCGALVAKLKVERWTFHSVISPAMGGILVGHEVGRHLKRRHIFAEKDEGKLKIRRFEVKPGEKFLVVGGSVDTDAEERVRLRTSECVTLENAVAKWVTHIHLVPTREQLAGETRAFGECLGIRRR